MYIFTFSLMFYSPYFFVPLLMASRALDRAIFFMLTSSFVFQPGIRVNLPKAVTSEVVNKELLVVTITESNEIFINERPISKEELVSRITIAAQDEQPLLIRADKKSDLGKVIEVWDVCRQVDVKQINIATTQ